ncbi:MAG: hypothetical protein LBE98_03400 [Puniceicoccales bacterium]|jgi:hypothetical protein|nr:hypothetical protein [Puniceicoccales bacterium]
MNSVRNGILLDALDVSSPVTGNRQFGDNHGNEERMTTFAKRAPSPKNVATTANKKLAERGALALIILIGGLPIMVIVSPIAGFIMDLRLSVEKYRRVFRENYKH